MTSDASSFSCLSSMEYETLLWTVAFRILEEPLQVASLQTLTEVGTR